MSGKIARTASWPNLTTTTTMNSSTRRGNNACLNNNAIQLNDGKKQSALLNNRENHISKTVPIHASSPRLHIVTASSRQRGTSHQVSGEHNNNINNNSGFNHASEHERRRRLASNAVAGTRMDEQDTKTMQEYKNSFTTDEVVDYYAEHGLHGYREHLGTLGQDSSADYTGEAYSVWDGTYAFGKYKEKAMFVDENACIGCQNCVHCSPKSFAIEPIHGRARVVSQWADDRDKLNMAFDSCPVNCIHWVDKDDLPIMEYAMRKMDRTHVSTQSHGAASKACDDPFEVAKEEKQKAKIVWSGPKCSWPRGA